MEDLTKEDVLALRLDVAELRREIAELRREIAARGLPATMNGISYEGEHNPDAVSTEQIATEWMEGEDAWKSRLQ